MAKLVEGQFPLFASSAGYRRHSEQVWVGCPVSRADDTYFDTRAEHNQ